jgi:prepilin-type N-terminal cleavage/methylation domain-containing protein
MNGKSQLGRSKALALDSAWRHPGEVRLPIRGVTLIELLVAVTLLGFVSLGLLFAMRIGIGSWQRGDARLAADRAVVAAGDLITTQLASAWARNVGWGPREQRVSFLLFEGAADRLHFLTRYSVASRDRGGSWLAEYWFEHDARNECRLLYNEYPFRSDDDAAAVVQQLVRDPSGQMLVQYRAPQVAPGTRILYTGIHDCAFEYLIEPADQGSARPVYWGKYWPGDPRLLPHAVAVRFRGSEGRSIAPVATVAMINAREVWP